MMSTLRSRKFSLSGRWRWLVFVQFGLGFLATVCLANQRADAKPFIIGTLNPLANFYPLRQIAGDNSVIRTLTNPPILSVQSDGRIVCILCKEVPELESSKDSTKNETTYSIVLELKKKLRWGDGKDITPQDVKFTLETMAKTDYQSEKSPNLPIKRVEMDPEQKNKLRLILTHKRADAFQLFAISLMPSHKSGLIQELLKNPLDANYWSKIQDPGLYYGAFAVKSAASERWLLHPNPYSSWDLPPTQDIELKYFNGIGSLGKALASGEIDQTAENELTWTQYLQLKETVAGLEQKFSVHNHPGQNLEVILLNLRSPALVNPQLRQILHHSINRHKIANQVMKGLGTPTSTFLHPYQLDRMNEKNLDAFQPQVVSQLIDQIGGKKAIDGSLTIDGQKISLVLNCSEGRLKTGIYQSVIDDLQKIGISVKIELSSEEDYVRNTLAHRRFKDMACMRWQLPSLSPPINLMHSLAIPSQDNNYFGNNYSGWQQQAVDRILESIQRDTEIARLQRQLLRLDKQFVSDLPALPLVYMPEIWLNRKDQLSKELIETKEQLSAYPTKREIISKAKM